jgi:hypothetical protein
VVRSILPAGIVLPPFQLDFSEEASRRTSSSNGYGGRAHRAKNAEIVDHMLECRKSYPEKWAALTTATTESLRHRRVMRNLKKQDSVSYDG